MASPLPNITGGPSNLTDAGYTDNRSVNVVGVGGGLESVATILQLLNQGSEVNGGYPVGGYQSVLSNLNGGTVSANVSAFGSQVGFNIGGVALVAGGALLLLLYLKRKK